MGVIILQIYVGFLVITEKYISLVFSGKILLSLNKVLNL